MVTLCTEVTPDDAVRLQAKADRRGMTLGAYLNWLLAVHANAVSVDIDAPIEEPWGEPHPVKGKGIQL